MAHRKIISELDGTFKYRKNVLNCEWPVIFMTSVCEHQLRSVWWFRLASDGTQLGTSPVLMSLMP